MKHSGVVTALLATLFLAAGGAALGAEATSPPTNLKLVGDHWTPWDPPAAGPDAYIIQKGDTLWDLADKWFQDPFLWPQIWDENRYVLDSHWIYPGDPLVVPGQPTVVPGEGIPPVADGSGAGDGSGDGAGDGEGDGSGEGDGDGEPLVAATPPMVPMAPPLVPMADPVDLYCSGSIETEAAPPSLWIAGHDTEGMILGEGDVVFLSGGQEAGIRSGDEFAVLRRGDDVKHPQSGQRMGTMFKSLGKARVMLAHDGSATAVIEMSCEDLRDGDELVPWRDVPVPMLAGLPEFERWDPTPSGGATGQVVAIRDNLDSVGDGYVIYTDLGRAAGVAPGDVVTLYRQRDGQMPRMNLGQAVILTVGPGTSMAKIVVAVRESFVGDAVEVLSQ